MSRKKYLEGMEEMERWYSFDDVNGEILRIIPLVRNGKFLLLGPYGYGKSLYAYLVGRIFFGYSPDTMPVVQLMDELSVNDVFFHVDVPSLMKGEERIVPRSIVTEDFKFINEFQRGNYRIYNALLGLFSEGFITLRDKKFHTKDYLAILDANPFDAGSKEIPAALMDRITGSINMRSLNGKVMLDLMDSTPDVSKAKRVLSGRDMREIWKEVEKISVPKSAHLLLTLIHGYFSNCIYGDRAVMDHFHVATLCSSCKYRTEPCSMLREPLGHRWWKDAIRIAKARAYYEGRGEINVDDIFFASLYALQHRVITRSNFKRLYSSKEEWIRESLENAKLRLRNVWIPALKGDAKARMEDERTLKIMEDSL